VIGALLTIMLFIRLFFFFSWSALLCVPLPGYGFAWIGHFIFERNKPLTIEYPLYAFLGDVRLVAETLTMQRKF
jgi:hypothetical protein